MARPKKDADDKLVGKAGKLSSNRKKRKEWLENGSAEGKLSNDSLQRNETQDTAYISIDKNRF